MKAKFEAMRKRVDSIRPERMAIDQAIAEQQNLKKHYDPIAGKSDIAFIDQKIADIKANAYGKTNGHYEALNLMNIELGQMLSEKSMQPLDLNDPKLTAALQLISLGKLDYTQANGIAQQFIGNQTALKLLQRTFQEKGITSGIEKLVYDPQAYQDAIREHIYNATHQGGTSGGLINILAKLAKLEGIELEGLDPAFIGDAARKSAGLAPKNDAPDKKGPTE